MKKSERRKRNETICVRATAAEKQKFLKRCDDSGLSTGDYFRVKCLNEKPLRAVRRVSPNKQELIRLRMALGKPGSNLNQIARKLNVSNWATEAERQAWEMTRQKHDETLDLIRKALGYDLER